MSRYDEEYQAHFTGLRGYKLWAHGTFYAGEIEYNPVRPEILVGPTNGFGRSANEWLEEIRGLAQLKNISLKRIREVYKRYELSDLARHPAIVIFPYAAMSYSIVDFYASNLPIFVPSIDIMTTQRTVNDRTVFMGSYCGVFEPIQPHPKSKHGLYDPNSENETDYKYFFMFMRDLI